MVHEPILDSVVSKWIVDIFPPEDTISTPQSARERHLELGVRGGVLTIPDVRDLPDLCLFQVDQIAIRVLKVKPLYT